MAHQNIFFATENSTGIITLNRPNALNALSLEMIMAFKQQLKQWAEDKKIESVMVRSNGERAFCAGGDIRALYQAMQENVAHKANEFFIAEYDLNHYIKHYPKRYIALLNGIAMGGGLGISINGSLRLAQANTQLAMPETAIGFFPDVGALYFLSQCPGYIGTYLGLLGIRINAKEALYAKLIDQIIDEENTQTLVNHLENERQLIDDCFSASSIEEILSRLEKTNTAWSKETIDTLKKRSPTSLKVTLKALQQARVLSFDECMRLTMTLANNFLHDHDLREGIRATVIDKDQTPHWQPAKLSEISSAMVEKYFTPML